MSNSRYLRQLRESDVLRTCDELRFDIVPDEQQNLIGDERLIQGVHMIRDTYPRYTGNAFFFVLKPEETVRQMCSRICNLIKLDEAEFKKCKVMFDSNYPSMSNARWLKPQMLVKEAVEKIEKDGSE